MPYVIDAETRVFDPKARIGLGSGFSLSLEQPIVWRGSGVLDQPIFEWHQAFGLPQGPRDLRSIEDDSYDIVLRTSDGENRRLRHKGTHLADLSMALDYQIREETGNSPALLSKVALQIPTGAKEYRLEGWALSAALFAEKHWSALALYAGGSVFISKKNKGFRNRIYEKPL